MVNKLANFSGFNIDNNKHNIIDDMIEELNILSEINSTTIEYSKNTSDYTLLRNDEIQPSYETCDILSNSKSKTQNGFYVNKII